MKTFIFGKSAGGLCVPAYDFEAVGKNKARLMLIGGVHGNESEGVVAAYGLLNHFLGSFNLDINVTFIPIFNPDGVFSLTRFNGNGVDLNRNLPTKDWDPKTHDPRYVPGPSANSEPENQALVSYLKANKTDFIISFHSWEPMVNINGDCRKEAEVISNETGYIITEDVGYPTPGSLGTYAGIENKIPTITLEILRGQKPRDTVAMHVPALLKACEFISKNRRR